MVSSWASSLSVALTDFFSSSFLPLSLLKSSPYVYLKLVAAPCVMDGVGVLSVVMFGPEMIVNTHNVIEVLIYEFIECINSGFQFCSVLLMFSWLLVRFGSPFRRCSAQAASGMSLTDSLLSLIGFVPSPVLGRYLVRARNSSTGWLYAYAY